MRLTESMPGAAGIISRLTGRKDTRAQLNALGFAVGQTVLVIGPIGKQIVVQLNESRIAVDRGLASHVWL